MFKILLALHLVFAVFAVGPLVHAATTASRGLRRGDAAAAESSVRVLRMYSTASVLVIAVGFALMNVRRTTGFYTYSSSGPPRRYADYLAVGGSSTVGQFSDLWIWLSLVLWLVAIALVLFLLVPALRTAAKSIAASEPVGGATARVAAGGGVVALAFVAIVVLMVYRPVG